jgi:AGZA family xanthine/uracil permease-like MFS transporter
MMGSISEIAWDEPLDAVPAFLTLVMIPLTFSIANGLAFGITAHALLKLLRGKAVQKDWFLFLLAGLFVARFIWMGAA